MQLEPRRAEWFAFTALTVVLLLLPGCVAEGTDFEAFPFFAVDKVDVAPETRATRVTIPIVLSSWDDIPPRRTVRGPGGGEIDAQAPKETRRTKLQILYPIVNYSEEGREHDFRLFGAFAAEGGVSSPPGPAGRALSSSDVAANPITRPGAIFGANPVAGGFFAFPLFGWDDEHLDPRDEAGGTKRDYGFYPLFMGGDWPKRGWYLSVAPIGGITYGFLGKDEMHWYGFPYPLYLYSRERSARGDIESRHILWPLVNWIEGGGRSGFRILPFYAHYTRTQYVGSDPNEKEAYDRHWVMWPFVSWARNEGERYDEATGTFSEGPTNELFVFPFYGRIEGPDRTDTTVLWPFFRFFEDKAANFWELRAPFPVFTVHHGIDPALVKRGEREYAERWRFDIWPVFGYRSRPGYVRHFAVWPIERYEARDDRYALDTKFYFLPLLEYHHHTEKKENGQLGEDYQRTRLFPFAVYRRSAKGDVQLHLLEPILWDDADGFERIYFPFFRLYEYRHGEREGSYSHRFLFGLVSYRSEPEVEGVTRGYSRLSLLFGLFQIRSGGTTAAESERTGLRMLYMPEIAWGGRS